MTYVVDAPLNHNKQTNKYEEKRRVFPPKVGGSFPTMSIFLGGQCPTAPPPSPMVPASLARSLHGTVLLAVPGIANDMCLVLGYHQCSTVSRHGVVATGI